MGRWSYFSPREKRIILDRVLLDDPLKTREHIKITGRDIWKTVTQITTLQHMLITLVAMSGFQGLNTYTPSMIKSFGFSAVRANALASVPVYASIVWTTILAYSSYVTRSCGGGSWMLTAAGTKSGIAGPSSSSVSRGTSFRMRVYAPVLQMHQAGTDILLLLVLM